MSANCELGGVGGDDVVCTTDEYGEVTVSWTLAEDPGENQLTAGGLGIADPRPGDDCWVWLVEEGESEPSQQEFRCNGPRDEFDPFTPIAAGLLLSVLVFALFPLAPYFWIFLALNAVLGLCAVLVFPVTQAATMEALPPVDRGSATGVWGMIMSLGGTLGMFVMSGVLSVFSIEWVFYASAGVTLALSLVVVAMRCYFD